MTPETTPETAARDRTHVDPGDSGGSGDVTITVCADGPLLVRGAVDLVDSDGARIDNQRNVVALCRCGRTGRPPFCDSSHKKKKRPPSDRPGR